MYKQKLVFMAACAGLAFFGVVMFALGPILFRLGAGATDLPSTLSIGIILGSISFGPIIDKFGYKWLFIAGAIMTLLGVQGLALFTEIRILHLSILILGFGGGILNGETIALVSEIYDDTKRASKMSLFSAFYCIGALLWTLLIAFIPNYQIPLQGISIVMALLIIFFCTINFPQAKPKGSVSLSKILDILKYPSLIIFSIILFFQAGFEGVSQGFSPKFLIDSAKITDAEATKVAGLSLTCFVIGMFAGRILLSWLLKKIKDAAVIYIYLSTALLGVAGLYYANSVLLIYVAMALIGFGIGATPPIIFSRLGGIFKDLSGTAFSIAIFVALCGNFTFTKITGLLFDKGEFMQVPISLALAIIIMMLLLPMALKRKEK